jgi:hypothetical protein
LFLPDSCRGPAAENQGVDGRRWRVCTGAVVVAIAAAGLTLVARGPQPAAASEWRVGNTRTAALFGDSLAQEAEADFVYIARLSGYAVEVHAAGGTAPCDWLGDLAELVARPAAERPSVAVIQFTGNNFTACMRPDGTEPSADVTVADYQRDATTFVTSLLGAGIRPVFALAPAVNHPSLVPQINALWQTLAGEYPGVGVVDAGAPVEGGGGTFSALLPCESWEHAAQGCWEGEVIVRAPDGTHFCPTEAHTVNGVVGVCNVPSPGAVRYALGLAEALETVPGSAAGPGSAGGP